MYRNTALDGGKYGTRAEKEEKAKMDSWLPRE